MKNTGLTKYFDGSMVSPFDKMVREMFNLDFTPTYHRSNVGSVNISESEKNYNIEVSVPGYKKEDINIDLEDDLITISGSVNRETNETNEKYSRREFSKSSFKRSFILPEDVTEEMNAKLNDGILTIELNKKQIEPKRKLKSIIIE